MPRDSASGAAPGDDLARWFLTAADRGNPDTAIDDGRGHVAWTEGNEAVALVHGATYFARLCEELATAGDGDAECLRLQLLVRCAAVAQLQIGGVVARL